MEARLEADLQQLSVRLRGRAKPQPSLRRIEVMRVRRFYWGKCPGHGGRIRADRARNNRAKCVRAALKNAERVSTPGHDLHDLKPVSVANFLLRIARERPPRRCVRPRRCAAGPSQQKLLNRAGDRGFNGLAVGDDTARRHGEPASAGSQSFHTGSSPSFATVAATSSGDRSSAMSNCPVARRPILAFAGILRQRHDPPALGAVEMFSTGARITAGFGMASALIIVTPRGINPLRRRAGSRVEHDPNVGEEDAQRAEELNQFTVGHFVRRVKFPRAGAQSRQRHGQLRLPAVPQKILGVGGKAQRLEAPICQAEQR